MIKVAFQTNSGGVYWAVCERMGLCGRSGAYLLDNVREDSEGRGPLAWVKTAADWWIVTVEEA